MTWVNDGGNHNVVADDASFTSGPPSTDMWQYSHTFHSGGSYPYSCEVHVGQGMVGTVTVAGVFADDLESGDDSAWPDSTGTRGTCTCYFSSDCVSGSFCDYGPGGFSTEDICTWVDGKPQGVPGANCNLPHVGPWGGEICDGVCMPAAFGSQIGSESEDLILQGVSLWADALLLPAVAGGGPPVPALVDAVKGLDFSGPDVAMNLGRQVSSLLILSGATGFYDHFCHWEQYPHEPEPDLWVDLSEDDCRANAARLIVDGLAAELIEPGSCAGVIDQIRASCPNWQQVFDAPCKGPKALQCVAEQIEETAVFLSTPRVLE